MKYLGQHVDGLLKSSLARDITTSSQYRIAGHVEDGLWLHMENFLEGAIADALWRRVYYWCWYVTSRGHICA